MNGSTERGKRTTKNFFCASPSLAFWETITPLRKKMNDFEGLFNSGSYTKQVVAKLPVVKVLPTGAGFTAICRLSRKGSKCSHLQIFPSGITMKMLFQHQRQCENWFLPQQRDRYSEVWVHTAQFGQFLFTSIKKSVFIPSTKKEIRLRKDEKIWLVDRP